mmetsp:Transcript_76225/g.176867  ORF Transcript_76225/g.176867 Transcript_76225/m.176867 type:complete len:262 (-) Transcript_76225:62-847(-)
MQPLQCKCPSAPQQTPGAPEVLRRGEDVPAHCDLFVVKLELLFEPGALLLGDLLPGGLVVHQGLLPVALTLEPAEAVAVWVVHNVDATSDMVQSDTPCVVDQRLLRPSLRELAGAVAEPLGPSVPQARSPSRFSVAISTCSGEPPCMIAEVAEAIYAWVALLPDRDGELQLPKGRLATTRLRGVDLAREPATGPVPLHLCHDVVRPGAWPCFCRSCCRCHHIHLDLFGQLCLEQVHAVLHLVITHARGQRKQSEKHQWAAK